MAVLSPNKMSSVTVSASCTWGEDGEDTVGQKRGFRGGQYTALPILRIRSEN